MIIVHIATTLSGGAGTGLWRYHRALCAQGVDSRILVINPPAGATDRVGSVRWRKRPLPARVLRRLGLWTPVPERLRARIAELDRQAGGASYELFSLPYSDHVPEEHPWVREADVINLHWVAGILDWPRFLRRVFQPIVLTLHDQQPYLGGFHYALDRDNNPQLSALEAEMKEIKQRALHGHRVSVMSNSRWNEAEARQSGFFPRDTLIETIYYPLDTAVYAPRPKLDARAAAGIPPDRLVVGFACENLDNKRKGFAELLEALTRLPDSLRAHVTLLSFGRDPGPGAKSRLGLPWRHLGFLATDEEKVTAYAAMDVFVAPSRAEAFGLTAIEAQAVGVPVLANPVGGLAEAVTDASSDFNRESFSPATLANGLTAILADNSQRMTRASKGRAEVSSRHDSRHIGPQLVELHESACH